MRPSLRVAHITTWPDHLIDKWYNHKDWRLVPMELGEEGELPTAKCKCSGLHEYFGISLHTFSYPGPAGECLHRVLVGSCPKCKTVIWSPAGIEIREYSTEELEARSPHES